ncbi:hypothetical protein LSAT2_016130 [Lamellibrachia satsuma]|nr:hypothetical protein LSAT2_016130 [Lamellibrachia satsuma]
MALPLTLLTDCCFIPPKTPSRVYKSRLDGTEVVEIGSSGLRTPWGVAIDYNHRHICWADPGKKCITCTDYNGRNPKYVNTTRNVRYVAIIRISDVKDDSLYYTHRYPNRVYSCRLDLTGCHVITSVSFEPTSIAVLPDYVAAAPDTDVHPLLGATDEAIEKIPVDRSVTPPVYCKPKLLISGGNKMAAVAVDNLRGRIYWSDHGKYIISRAALDGSDQKVIVNAGYVGCIRDDSSSRTFPNQAPDRRLNNSPLLCVHACSNLNGRIVHGLTVDTVTNKIYFTYMAVVEMMNPDGSGRTRVIEHSAEVRTYGIAVDIADRFLFHSTQNPARVYKSRLDGTKIVEIVSSGLRTPWGVAIDYNHRHICWADSVKKCITCTDYNGRNPKQVNTTGSVRHVALIQISDVEDDSLYYAQSDPNSVFSCRLNLTRCSAVGAMTHETTGIVVWPDDGMLFVAI